MRIKKCYFNFVILLVMWTQLNTGQRTIYNPLRYQTTYLCVLFIYVCIHLLFIHSSYFIVR